MLKRKVKLVVVWLERCYKRWLTVSLNFTHLVRLHNLFIAKLLILPSVLNVVHGKEIVLLTQFSLLPIAATLLVATSNHATEVLLAEARHRDACLNATSYFRLLSGGKLASVLVHPRRIVIDKHVHLMMVIVGHHSVLRYTRVVLVKLAICQIAVTTVMRWVLMVLRHNALVQMCSRTLVGDKGRVVSAAVFMLQLAAGAHMAKVGSAGVKSRL